MGKKAPRRNGFFFFMRDFKRDEEARGRRFENGYQGVSKVAGEIWKSLSQERKDEYKREADDYNKSEERNQGVPLPGINVSKKKKKAPVPPNRALTIKEARQKREREFIMNLVDGMNNDEFMNYTFYFAHVNVFCKTEDNEYVPAEIGISRFSLKENVTDVFHRILNPGVTPLGYSYTIKEHSEKTHRIPLDFIKGTQGYLGMYKEIKNFLQPFGDSGRPSALYTMFDEPFHNCSMSAVKYSLKRIWETCNFVDEDEDSELAEEELYEEDFRVMSLPMLFFHLKNRCASTFNVDGVPFENTSEANILLLNDKYEFNEELACQFHKDIDNVRYCSQSYTVRWAQVIREHCLQNVSDNEEEAPIPEPNNEELKKEHDLLNKVEKIDETSPLKSENEIKKKEEKYDVKKENDSREIKDERERDEHSRYKKERDRGYSDERMKRERDRGYGDERIKRERDRGYDDERIKRERNRGYDERIKRERDRGYDDDRYKRRDRNSDRYDNARIKKEREDRHCSSNEDLRVKKEREDRHRSSETEARSRTKRENLIPEYDVLKEEVLYIPADVKVERSSGSDSSPRESSSYPSTSRDSRIQQDAPSEVKVERSDNSRVKQEPTRSDYVDFSTNVKVKRFSDSDSRPRESSSYPSTSRDLRIQQEPPSKVKVEHSDNSRVKQEPTCSDHVDISTNVKVERPKETPSNIKVKIEPHIKEEPPRPTPYVDITSDDYVKIEPIDSRDSVPKIKIEPEAVEIEPEYPDVDYESILKTEHLDILDVKPERIIDVDQPSAGPGKSLPSANVKIEPIDNVNQRPSGSNTSQDAKSTNSTASKASEPVTPKKERDPEFPLPIPNKTEFSPQTNPSGRPAKPTEMSSTIPPPSSLPLPTIKVEKDGEVVKDPSNLTQPAAAVDQVIRSEFPMPKVIKVEKEPANQADQSKAKFSMPIKMKTETPKNSRSSNDISINDEFPLLKKIKLEDEPAVKTERSSPASPSPSSSSERVKKEAPDFYLSHGMKNEEVELPIESDSESMEWQSSVCT